jgi:prepilin-type processing-associated H-X9-DG protein
MPIPFTCPHCHVQTDVADEFAGRSGPCANCGRTITVPATPPAPQAPAGKAWTRMLSLALLAACILGALLACGGVVVKVLFPAVRSIRQTDHQAQCLANLQQIAMAVYDYRQRYDTFPPPVITDEDGRAMHSWRVLILPFLDQQELYDRYDFGQSWDSPDNRELIEMIPKVYRCPADPSGRGSQTSYLMIVGPGTFPSVTGPTRLDEFPDGGNLTLMLVETVNSGIDWTEPRDLNAEEMSFEVNDPAGGAIGSRHPGGAHVALCDGTVRFLSDWTSPEQVQAMTTVDGGETIPAN